EQRRRDREAFRALRADNARHAAKTYRALRAWQRHDLVEAERILAEVDGKFQQTWEQRHLRGLCRRKALPLLGHTGGVSGVAFSGDGKRVASGSDDGTIKVWDAATGQDKLTLRGHTGGVTSVAFSGDGKRIASGSHDGTVKVWDSATGQDRLTLKGH